MRPASFTHNVTAQQEAVIHNIHEAKTGSWQYIVADPSTSHAIIIDPVLDYDAATAKITTQAADSLLSIVEDKGYTVQMILETHAHADHLTAANYLQKKLGKSQGVLPPVGIGKRIAEVQQLWAERYGIPAEEYRDAFDKLLDDDESFSIGSLSGVAIHLPGHTPDHMGYIVGGESSVSSAHCNQ